MSSNYKIIKCGRSLDLAFQLGAMTRRDCFVSNDKNSLSYVREADNKNLLAGELDNLFNLTPPAPSYIRGGEKGEPSYIRGGRERRALLHREEEKRSVFLGYKRSPRGSYFPSLVSLAFIGDIPLGLPL